MAEIKRRRRIIDTFAARNLHELERPASIGAVLERAVRGDYFYVLRKKVSKNTKDCPHKS